MAMSPKSAACRTMWTGSKAVVVKCAVTDQRRPEDTTTRHVGVLLCG